MTDDSHTPGSDTTIERRPYLGDPQVLDKILRTIAREGVNCRIAVGQGILSTEDANLIDEKETRNASAILLGRNRQYAIDTNWNIPGVIDSFVANELSLETKGPEDILAAGLNKFLREIHDRLETVNLRQLDADWEKRVDDIFVKYRNIYLGIGTTAAVEGAGVPAVVFPVAEVPSLVAKPAPTPVAPEFPMAQTAVAPSAKQMQSAVAAQKPEALHTSAAQSAPTPRRFAAWQLAAAAIVLLLLISGGVLMLSKPAPEPVPAPQVVAPTPPPPKPVAAATAILKDGKLSVLDENGNVMKTVGFRNPEAAIVRLFDMSLEPGREQFLVAKSVKPASDDAPAGNDLWLVDSDGKQRLVNNAVMHARFSPDATKLAYSTTAATLRIEDNAGATLAEVPGVYEPTWRKDNEVAFFIVPEERTIWPPEALSIATYDLTTKTVKVITDGRFDDMVMECHPLQKWLLITAGAETGLPSFWKVPTAGGEPAQITNVRLNESGEKWVPTPFVTSLWSKDGRWFLYDFKDGTVEQTWGLEFDDKGNLKRALHLADGLFPKLLGADKFICMKRQGQSFEMVTQKLP